MLGVFLLPAFIRLGHERQDLLKSVQWNACVHKLDLGLYSQPKEFGGIGVRIHVNSKGKIRSTGNIVSRGGSNPQHCIKSNEASALPMSYSGPLVSPSDFE